MSFVVEYVSGRLFIDGIWGSTSTNGYFSCHHPSCPFSLKVVQKPLNDIRVVVGVESVLFGFHNHEATDKSKAKVKAEMKMALDVVSLYPKNPESVTFKAKCDEWLETALKDSQAERDRLIDLEAVRIYAIEHPNKSAREVFEASKVKMHVRSICKMRQDARKAKGEATNLKELITKGGHHLLGHDKDDILVFGTMKALDCMSVTPIIQCDGTFTCVVLPFTQLYIFHAVLENGVTYPMLYCLMEGKNEGLYVRLLKLIEEIAMNNIHKPIFKRPVEFMMDFETAMVNAVRQTSEEAKVLCCFFHFTANIRKRCVQIMAAIKKTVRQNAEKMSAAKKTKRAVMMLPLLPEELITTDLVDKLLARFDAAVPECAGAFGPLRDYLVSTYVRQNARHPRRRWSVSGRKIRTNNAAESCHAQLNGSLRVSGAVTFDIFIFAIETQMASTTREIVAGCEPRSKTIFAKRDELLKAELAKLFRGEQGVFKFLDHCSSVLFVRNQQDIRQYNDRLQAEVPDPVDRLWIEQNRQAVCESMAGLFQRLTGTPATDIVQIMTTIEQWTFAIKQTTRDEIGDHEASVMSMVNDGPSDSFIEIRKRVANEIRNRPRKRHD